VLSIRREQIQVFQHSLENSWLVSYLKSCYPQQTNEIGSQALRELVEKLARDAHLAGAVSSNAILKYVNVAFVLGSRFQENETLGWARAIWTDPRFTTVFERLDKIERALAERLQRDP
jgi:hypothetical protein